jgi:cytoskeletal protein CcmA (bactofilin family)
MKKKVLLLGGVGIALLLIGFGRISSAQQFRHGNNTIVGQNEKIDGSTYLAGTYIDVAGEVNGDLFCAGQNITISGTIHGDIICAGQNLTITGTVDGNVRTAGQTVLVSANIGRNLTVASQDFTLSSDGEIAGDITGGVNNMVINGSVGRDLVLGATDATINGSVGRNIKSRIDHLSLGNSAKIGGSIEYASNNELNRASGAIVAGSVHRTTPKPHENKSGWFGIGFRIYWFLAMLVVALALVLIFPSIFRDSAGRTMKSPARTLLLGLAATLFTPVLFVLLFATIVGIPLGLILLLGWIIALILSGPFAAYLIGREIWRNQHNAIWTMLLGAVILLLIYNIPWIGFIAMLAAVFVGMGMVVRELTYRTPKPTYRPK